MGNVLYTQDLARVRLLGMIIVLVVDSKFFFIHTYHTIG